MKRIFILAIIASALLAIWGCGNAKPSSFVSTFSPQSILDELAPKIPMTSPSSGSGHNSNSGASVRNWDIDVIIPVGTQTQIVDHLRTRIEQQITSSGLAIRGKGKGTEGDILSFSFAYTSMRTAGDIYVYAVPHTPAGQNRLKLIFLIHEY